MHLKLIACKALYREISLLSASCPNCIDTTYLRQGLHDTPALLARALQEQIDHLDSGDDLYSFQPRFGRDLDAVLIGYGLCSNAVIGLKSERYTLVIPRCDDCISLILGSRERYLELFEKHAGNYWYTPSWIENGFVPSEENQRGMEREYEERYGKENALYILSMEQSLKDYTTFSYADWERLSFPEHEEYARRAARFHGMEFQKYTGNEVFLSDFLNGNWDDRFLIVPPGKTVEAEYNGRLITYEGEQL